MRHRYYLSLGSNIGDRAAFLAEALRGIGRLGSIPRVSSIYETEPVEFADQPPFLNIVAEIETDAGPEALLERLREVEAGVGRKAEFRFGPREIDIDIILWSGGSVHTPELEIPHARMMERGFVLVPLAEVAPDLVLPTGESATAAAQANGGGVVRWGSAPQVDG